MANERIQCLMEYSDPCRRTSGLRPETSFYANIGKNYSKQKKMHVCKDCIQAFIGDMRYNKENAIEQALKLFPFLDVAYIHELFTSMDDIGVYFRTLSVNYKDRSAFKDSVFPSNSQIENLSDVDQDTLDLWLDRWGEGWTVQDYIFLEKRYERLTDEYEADDYSLEVLFQQICLTQLNIFKANRVGAATDKLIKQLQDLMSSAELKPSQRSGDKSASQTLGLKIKEIEETEPIVNDPEFADQNKIEYYFEKHFVKHFARMLELTK